MSDNETRFGAGEREVLWFRFIAGRTVVTGALLLVIIAVQGIVPQAGALPLYLLALTQFAVNGVYFYLWRKRDLAFCGYFVFGLEIILLSLLIFVLGPEGAYFLLGYLWPIMMGGWLIGPHAILPLTLLASVSYAVLIVLQQIGIQASASPLLPGSTPLGALLGLVYLVPMALVVWVLNTQMSHQRQLLHRRNQALRRANADLHALLNIGRELSTPDAETDLIGLGLEQLRNLVGEVSVGAYVIKEDMLVPHVRHRLVEPDGVLVHHALENVPWWSLWERFLTGDGKAFSGVNASGEPRHVYLVPMSSSRSIEGCLAVVSASDRGLTSRQRNIIAFLARSLGSALEVRRLFDDLKRERDLIVNVLNNLGEGVLVADAEDTVLLTNPAAKALVATRVGTKVPRWIREIRSQEDEPQSCGDRFLSIQSVPLDNWDGNPDATVYVIRDVTDERMIHQQQSDFVAYVAHELRTPLTTMRTLTRLLEHDDLARAKRAEYLAVITSQIERQNKLVQDLLNLSRLEAGSYELSLDLLDIREVVREAVSVCEPIAASSGQHVQVDLPDDALLVHTSRDGMQQVLVNLVSNAIKFTEPTKALGVHCWRTDAWCRICVWDRGVGMSPEEQDKIFAKYVSRSARYGVAGTGLGLVISKMILDQLGGTIEVSSKQGKGSEFTVSLPLRAPAHDAGLG